MKKTIITLTLTAALIALHSQVEWRYNRTGMYSSETGLLKSWPTEGPELLWHFEGLGRGYTSVAIANNRIFATGEHDDVGYLFVFDMNGQLLQRMQYGPEFTRSYPGSRNTVIPSDGRLYIVSGHMVLYCFDMQTLQLLWQRDYAKDFAAQNTRHGWHGTPLIVDDKLIIGPGGEEHNIVALNKATGELLWSSRGTGEMSGYGSPIFIGSPQVPQAVFMMADNIVGIDVSNGQMLWAFPHTNRMREHPNTPVFCHNSNMLFVMSAYGKGSVMLRLTNGGRNAEKAWELTELGNQTGHVMKYGDYIYGPGNRLNWYCVNWRTGEIMYHDDRLAVGCIIAADGMLYIYTTRGEMALVRPNSERFEIVSQFPITLGTGEHWAHPVIHDGVLYVRQGDALMAYRIR
jgi:outer membrane protein assembly factor BamB